MIRIAKTFLVLVLLATSAYAQERNNQNFAYGFNIEGEIVVGDQPYIITLPAHVYENSAFPDLRDMTLFNASGETVPFALFRPKAKEYKNIEGRVIPFYAVNKESDNKTYVAELIADISDLTYPPISLKFDFNEEEDFNGAVTVSVSYGDPGKWEVFAANESVTYLRSGKDTLLRNEVRLKNFPENVKLIRVEASPVHILPMITGMHAEFSAVPQFDRVEKIMVSGAYESEKKDKVNFKLPGFYPVEWISLNVPSSYLFPDFSVNVRNRDEEDWKTLIYRKVMGNYSVMPGVTGVSGGYGRYKQWQVAAPSSLPADGTGGVFYWRADEMVFLAKGQGPYTLAYGNATYKNSSESRQTTALLEMIPHAGRIIEEFTPFMIAGDKAMVKVIPTQNRDTQKMMLLAILGLVVIVISGIAVRLIIQMNRNKGA